MARFDLTDFEWSVIQPLLPNKPRGVARVDDRRVLNGIFWRLRTGPPWADIPERYGPHTTFTPSASGEYSFLCQRTDGARVEMTGAFPIMDYSVFADRTLINPWIKLSLTSLRPLPS